ncbi:MAG TPA: hypothetical protein VFZ27_00705 [Terriglobia bacterium]|nr:hypothetical protein [Terriglobia bacterium]
MRCAPYFLLSACLLSIPAIGQQAHQTTQNPLLNGKLMYVGKMPENLDGWIINDLSVWGKYKPTRQIEGADLVMKAYEPEMKVQYKLRRGIPQPKEVRKDRDRKHVIFSIIVDDWVTGQQVWKADVMGQKPKRHQNNAPSADAEIDAGGCRASRLRKPSRENCADMWTIWIRSLQVIINGLRLRAG